MTSTSKGVVIASAAAEVEPRLFLWIRISSDTLAGVKSSK